MFGWCGGRNPCLGGGMLESGIGSGVNIELATLGNFTYPGDLFPSERFYVEDLTEPAVTVRAGEAGLRALAGSGNSLRAPVGTNRKEAGEEGDREAGLKRTRRSQGKNL